MGTRAGAGAGACGVGLPLRVLYSFPHPLGGPGIGTAAYHQVLSLWRQGIGVRVACTSLARPLPAGLPVVETMALAGRRLPPRALGVRRARAWHDAAVAAMLARGRYEVVHVWPGAALRSLRAARRLGIAGVREVPNTHTAHAYAVVGREAARIGLPMQPGSSHSYDERTLRLEEAEYAAAARLLVPSEVVAKTFVDRGVEPERLARHRYGFDPQIFAAPTGFTPAPAPGQPLHVVFVGHCEPRKGLHLLLDAWDRAGLARAARLTVCGSFWPSYRTLLAPALARAGAGLAGFVEDVPAFLRGADVLALPSVEEGSALVTYEAQASGAALLVSRQAGAVVDDGRQGLVHEAGDVGTLARQLRRLDDDRDLLARLRRGALANSSRLTWDHAGTDLLAGYRAGVRSVLESEFASR